MTTHWSARKEAVKPTANPRSRVLKALDKLSETNLSAKATEDRSMLLKYFKSFKGLILIAGRYKTLVQLHTANLFMETTFSTGLYNRRRGKSA